VSFRLPAGILREFRPFLPIFGHLPVENAPQPKTYKIRNLGIVEQNQCEYG
jgi:hypothetical protein